MVGLAAGDLDRRVTILVQASDDDGLSNAAGSFEPLDRRWAKKTDIGDAESVAAATVGRTVSSRFLMRWDALTSAITGSHRLECEGVTYQVVGVREAIGRRVAIEVSANAILS